jgi:hypothetical protein
MMDNSQQYETYELVMKDNEDEVFALSLVSNPAIQSNFVYFSADGKKELVKFATTDEDQRTIVGPILIPDMKILRLKMKELQSSRPSSVASKLSIRDPIESTKTLLSQSNRFRTYVNKHTSSLTSRNHLKDNPYEN